MYFWKDSNNKEVDVLCEWDGMLRAIEIKSSQTMNLSDVKDLIYFSGLAPLVRTYVLYAGHQKGTYQEAQLVSLSAINALFDASAE